MSNEKQQTVVDRIVNLLNKEGFAPVLTEEEIKSFTEMEKEQMCKFAYKCHNHYKVYGDFNIEQYYKQTYGGGEQWQIMKKQQQELLK